MKDSFYLSVVVYVCSSVFTQKRIFSRLTSYKWIVAQDVTSLVPVSLFSFSYNSDEIHELLFFILNLTPFSFYVQVDAEVRA